MTLNIKVGIDNCGGVWDEVVNTSPHGTIFHTWKFLKILEKHTCSNLYPLMVYRGTTLIGIYPFFIKRKGFVKLAFSPYKGHLLYLGPVIPDYENLKQDKKESIFIMLQQEVDKFLFSELNCKYVKICPSPGLFDSRPLRWSGYQIEPFYTYRINLTNGEKNVWELFDRKLRVDINKAVREGVKVDEGVKEDLEFIHSSVLRRFMEQGSKLPPDYSEYLLELYNEFYPDNMKIFIAKYKGERVGGMISLCYKDIMYLWVGVPRADLKGISPNDLVQWEAIKWACNNGFKYYEEMDAGQPRLRQFKSKYNPDLAIWYSAVKYSSYIYKIAESLVKRT